MRCEEYRVLIEDYVDGLLEHKAAALVTSHTATCEECANFYQELNQEQELYSRYQRDVEITPVLWASIAARIKQEQPPQPQGLVTRLREQFVGLFSAPRLSPAFTAALVIIAIGATVFVMSRLNSWGPGQIAGNNTNTSVETAGTSNSNAGVAAPTPIPAPKQGTEGVVAGGPANATPDKEKLPNVAARQTQRVSAAMTPAQLVRDAEYKYLTAISMLSRDVNRRRSQLDPMLLARFDASLAEIDRTIKETRQVVRGNPEDPIALQYLLAAYSKKVDVLREMTNN